MECAVKPTKSSSNISEIVSKIAKVGKFRSIGVFSSENPNHFQHQEFYNDVKDCGRENEKELLNVSKVHDDSDLCGHFEILKLFEIVSKLKLAYVQLQEAHIPYDPEKIRDADELVFSQLEGLSKIRRAIKEKQFKRSQSLSACSNALRAETKVQERLLESLKAEVKKKDIKIHNLKRELCDLDSKNRMLVEEIKKQKRETAKCLNFSSIEDVVKEVSKGIHVFAKPLIALMKALGWDLDEAANAIQDSAVYSVRSHKKYAFEAYISRRMFHEFSFKSYNFHDAFKFDDPIDVLAEDPCSNFAKFCRTKYLSIVHPKIEASFFGNLDQRNLVLSFKHPRTHFYQLFVKMARWVWVLQGIASNPNAEMFIINRGSEFNDVYMECVEDLLDEQGGRFKVELMVMPGFRIGETLIKSRVYISKIGNVC